MYAVLFNSQMEMHVRVTINSVREDTAKDQRPSARAHQRQRQLSASEAAPTPAAMSLRMNSVLFLALPSLLGAETPQTRQFGRLACRLQAARTGWGATTTLASARTCAVAPPQCWHTCRSPDAVLTQPLGQRSTSESLRRCTRWSVAAGLSRVRVAARPTSASRFHVQIHHPV